MSKAIGIVMCLSVATTALELPETEKRVFNELIDSAVNCRFNAALNKADSLIAADTIDPLPSMLKLITIGLRDLDYDIFVDTSALIDAYLRTITRCDQYDRKHGKTSYSLTVRGCALATYASFRIQQKKYFAAVDEGFGALRCLREAQVRDPGNADADYFLGLYEYAIGDLKVHFWWILFWHDGNKRNGIKRLYRCSLKSEFSATAAQLSLIDVYIKEGEYGKAAGLVEKMQQRYPESRFILWAKARYFEAQKYFEDAADVYLDLAGRYRKTTYGTHNGLVVQFKAAQLYAQIGRDMTAYTLCREIYEKCRGADKEKKLCDDVRKLMETVDTDD
jgi:hypothetical protein